MGSASLAFRINLLPLSHLSRFRSVSKSYPAGRRNQFSLAVVRWQPDRVRRWHPVDVLVKPLNLGLRPIQIELHVRQISDFELTFSPRLDCSIRLIPPVS